ncbi:MAG: DHA2 family efflux MFS transporter permease subunit [Actinomycetota bacterium]|nr:DHA2 family efflux MFS transporter permease subunit [Actinomycetota bacterium]
MTTDTPSHRLDRADLPLDPAAAADARRRRMILIATCTALMAVVASVSGLNVAQQQLAVDLGAGQSALLWAINGYTIALAALLLPIGAIGDRWGRKHVLVGGLVLFAVANVVASAAGTISLLIAARVLAGVGAAMIMPVTLSVITSSFPAEERGNAIGVWSGIAGAGGIFGLISSAFLVDNFTWPWVFMAPTVLALGALAMTVKFVPHSREHHTGRFDTLGSVLSALAVGGLVLAIHEGPEVGWTAPLTVLGAVVGIASAIWFVRWELRQERPLIDLRVFGNRAVAGSSVALMATFVIIMGLFLVVVQFLQAVLGFSALRAAVGLLPMAAMMMPMSTIAPRIAQRTGLRPILTAGISIVGLGLAMTAAFGSVDGGYLTVLPGLMIIGFGTGLAMTPGTTAITGSLPEDKQGVASALNDTVREFGGAIGIALVGSLLNAGYKSSVSEATVGLSPELAESVKDGIGSTFAVAPQLGADAPRVIEAARNAFVDGWALSMWASAVAALVAAVFVWVWIPKGTSALGSDALDLVPVEDDDEQLVLSLV